jgi:hypothetical protein
VRKRADQVASPRAARQYRNLLLDAGFRDATVEVHTGMFTDGSFLPVFFGLGKPRSILATQALGRCSQSR